MGTTTGRQYSFGLTAEQSEMLDIMSGGDDDLREALISHAFCLLGESFIEEGACSRLEDDAHDRFHELEDAVLAYNNVQYPKWRSLYKETIDLPF